MKHSHQIVSAIIGITLMVSPVMTFAAFDVNLSVGARGGAVVQLQQFLISRGMLASHLATGFFGNLTLQAVKQFQASEGIKPISGFFGPLTRAKANLTTTPLNTSSPLSVTQTTGTAPLTVTFTSIYGDPFSHPMSWVDGRDITIDFGDGTPHQWMQCPGTDADREKIVASQKRGPAGYFLCTVSTNHTYYSAGTYTAKLIQEGGMCAGGCKETVIGTVTIQTTFGLGNY